MGCLKDLGRRFVVASLTNRPACYPKSQSRRIRPSKQLYRERLFNDTILEFRWTINTFELLCLLKDIVRRLKPRARFTPFQSECLPGRIIAFVVEGNAARKTDARAERACFWFFVKTLMIFAWSAML